MSVRSSLVAVGVALVGIVTIAVCTLAPRTVFAQATTGDTVDIAAPSADVITIAGVNDKGDALLFTGKPIGFMDATGCAGTPGSYPVQDVVVVDPGGNRATRVTNVIVITQQTALKPGTRLVDVNALGPCTLAGSGVTYNRYRGTVE